MIESLVQYIHKLFDNNFFIFISSVSSFLLSFLFPETQYFYSSLAVLGIMVLDLITKLYALKRQSGGWKKSLYQQNINSFSLFRGTIDKLLVFGVMMIICGLAYRLTVISDVALWFTQAVYTLMFLRDILSIFENLVDAGISEMGIFQKIVKKKLNEYVDTEEIEQLEDGSKG